MNLLNVAVNSNSDISVVLTLYKKPEALRRQLEAIKNQTIRPKEICLFQDGIANDYKIELQESLLSEFDKVCICTENKGVWERFSFAKTLTGKYVCIFDDDTIPCPKWIENCYYNMQKQEGIYGTIGIVLTKKQNYPFGGYYRVGWARPYYKIAEVDFVGHSWFLKREWLEWMFEGTEEYQKLKYVAEDICLSVQCQKHGIKTYTPAHPWREPDVWGAVPKFSLKWGMAWGSVSSSEENTKKMNEAIVKFKNDNWHPLYKTNVRLANKQKREIALYEIMWLYMLLKKIFKRLFGKHWV
jgi:glycosyltransferase involved in cell wall biosynthesis